jgi:hypothetical protein
MQVFTKLGSGMVLLGTLGSTFAQEPQTTGAETQSPQLYRVLACVRSHREP